MSRFVAGLGLTSITLWVITLIAAAIAWIQGIVMVFKASVLLGILAFFFQVPYMLEAVLYWFTGYDLARHIAQALALPF